MSNLVFEEGIEKPSNGGGRPTIHQLPPMENLDQMKVSQSFVIEANYFALTRYLRGRGKELNYRFSVHRVNKYLDRNIDQYIRVWREK